MDKLQLGYNDWSGPVEKLSQNNEIVSHYNEIVSQNNEILSQNNEILCQNNEILSQNNEILNLHFFFFYVAETGFHRLQY